MTRIPQRFAGLLRPARAIAAVLITIAGVTCRDLPTEPEAAGNGALLQLTGLTVTPSLDTLLVGETVSMIVKNSNGSAINKQAAWTSSDTSVAKVLVTGLATATVSARKAGTVTITATSQNKGGSATIVVRPVPVRSVAVTPDSASVQRGDSVQYTATPKDSAGNALTGRTIAWSVADTLVARARVGGSVLTLARGTTKVRATVEAVVGEVTLFSRVAQLTVGSLSTIDSANVGDSLDVAYTVKNLWDSPNADSIIVRIGLKGADGNIHAARRRALPRVTGGGERADTVRLAVGPTVPSGTASVVAYADCRDAAAIDAVRLAACQANPADAGSIAEGDETDNVLSRRVVVRGPDITITALAVADSAFTRTTLNASITLSNSGSGTTAFDLLGGLFDVTAGEFVVANGVAVAPLGSRQTRAVDVTLALGATLDVTHTYEVRTFADCRGTGATVVARVASCYANPNTSGDVAESNETNNTAARAVAIATNVARVDAQPDSAVVTALGDEVALTATAYDRANTAVNGVAATWTSLDPTIVSIVGSAARAVANGAARVVATSEGRADTILIRVAQSVARVNLTPATAMLGSLGETTQLAAAVLDRNENAVVGATVVWATLDPSIASVNATGLVTANAIGSARIVASSAGAADTTFMSVAQLAARVVAAPATATAASVSDSAQFTAVVYDANGNPIPGASTLWSTPDSSIASVSATGLAVARSNGTARIIASSGSHADTTLFSVQQVVATVIASPDSAVITALGGAAPFTAVARDARGHAIAGAPISWTALDPSIATITNGAASAISAGRARAVASSGSAADTVMIIVEQHVAAVIVAPDTALISVAGSVGLAASARDGSGNPMSGVTLAWSTLDPSIASVSGGSVTGIASGTARIVASVDGAADTAIVFVNPAGYALRWIGARSTSGQDAANWYPHMIPDSTKSTLVPAGTPNPLVLATAPLVTASFRLDAGASITGTGSLHTYGNLESYGTMATTTSLSMLGSGTVRGSLANVVVGSLNGPLVIATLVGRTTAEDFSMMGYPAVRGRVVLNGNTLLTSSLEVGAGSELIQTNPADSLIVPFSLWAYADGQGARSQLTAGVSVIGGEYRVTGMGDSFSPTGTHKVVVTGSGNQFHDLNVEDTTSNAFQNIEIEGGQTKWSGGIVGGRMVLKPGATMAPNPNLPSEVRVRTALPETDGATYNMPMTKVIGDVTLTRNHRYDQNVSIDNNGRLTLGGHKLEAQFLATYFGTLKMNTAADTLLVRAGGSFYGIHSLSAGTLITNGMFTIGAGSSSPVPGSVWSVSGTHKVVFDGTQAQTFSTNDSTYRHFQNLEIRNTGGITFNGVTNVSGLLKMVAGGKAIADYNGRVKVFTQLPDVVGGSYDVATTVIAGQITADRNVAIPLGLSIDDNGSLRLAGHSVSAGTFQVYHGALTMDAATDTLTVRESGSFYGIVNLTAGTLALSSPTTVTQITIDPQPQVVPGAVWNVSGTHKILINGFGGAVINTNKVPAVAHDMDVRGTNGMQFMGESPTISGLLRVFDGGVVKGYNGSWYGIRFTTQLPELYDGAVIGFQSVVSGNLTATKDLRLDWGLSIDSTGSLRLGGHHITTGQLGIGGRLTMDDLRDTLEVETYGSFYGAENLSAGTLILGGSLSVGQVPGSAPGGWNPSGSHKTVFTNPYSQGPNNVDFYTDTTMMRFNHVEVRNTQGVQLKSGTTIDGLLKLVNGGKVSAVNGYSGLKFTSQLPDISGGTYDVENTQIVGNVTATRSETYTKSVFVDAGGNLSLGGHKLDMTLFGTHFGTLTMNGAADTLVIRQAGELYGVANLSAGTLLVQGNLRIGQMPNSVSAFHASGSHTTVFSGTQPSLTMPSDSASYFNNFKVEMASELQIPADLDIRGQLIAAGATLRSGLWMQAKLKIGGGLDVAGLTLGNISLDVTGGTLTRFDNVTFEAGYASPALLRIRNAGSATAFTMNNIAFLQPYGGGSLWVEAIDTDPNTPALVLDIVSPQAADGPGGTSSLNGASVTWRPPQGGGGLRP